MLKHILLFKMKENALGKTKKENAEELVRKLIDMKDKIKEIQHIEAGINCSKSKNSYDVGMYSEFKNKEELNIYREHPVHKKVLEFINEVCEDRKVVDYEI